MSNQIWGILTVFLCTLGYYYSWKSHQKGSDRIAILLLIASGLALRLFASLDFFLHDWDEQFHALVAKHLIQHPLVPTLYETPVLPYDHRDWTSNHIWLHKQPLPLWLMAASMSIFGTTEVALRLPSIILTTAGIALTYFIANYLLGAKVGYLAAFFYSINGLIIEVTSGRTGRDHIDSVFIFFVELAILLSILGAQRKGLRYAILVGVSTGAAVLAKWLPALVVLPIWLFIVLDSRRFTTKAIMLHFAVMALVLLCTVLPWHVYINHRFPVEAAWEAGFNVKHVTQALEGHGGPIYYYIHKVARNYGELIWVPVLWFLWKTLRSRGDLKRWAVVIWFIIPFVFFSCVKTKVQEYILFTAPALFLMASEFWNALADHRLAAKNRWLRGSILCLLILLPIRYTIERVKPFKNMDRRPAWVTDLKAMGRERPAGILFNYRDAIKAMFYTNLTVYPSTPDRATIADLVRRGHAVILNDNGRLPAEVKGLKNVSYVRLR